MRCVANSIAMLSDAPKVPFSSLPRTVSRTGPVPWLEAAR
jgi:hypothetical protein